METKKTYTEQERDLASRKIAHFLMLSTLTSEYSDVLYDGVPIEHTLKGHFRKFVRELRTLNSRFFKQIYDNEHIESQLRMSVDMTEILAANITKMTQEQYTTLISVSGQILTGDVVVLSEEDVEALNNKSK
jgi:hypothetical protein